MSYINKGDDTRRQSNVGKHTNTNQLSSKNNNELHMLHFSSAEETRAPRSSGGDVFRLYEKHQSA
jgi:hypothetical protein